MVETSQALPKANPSGRYQITASPAALPGSCFICNSSGREFFIDLQMQFEFHGAVYICNVCVEELARMMGMISSAQADRFMDTIKGMGEGLFERDIHIENLERALNAYTSLGNAVNLRPDFSPVPDVDSVNLPDNGSDSRGTGPNVSESNGKSDSGKESASKSSASGKSGKSSNTVSDGSEPKFSLGLGDKPGDE